MMRNRKRTTESSARFAICHIRIGKENTLRSCKTIGYMASLAYKTILYFRTVDDARPFADDRVFADNACTDVHICVFGTENGAIAKPACPRNLAVVVNDSNIIGNIK